MPDSYVKYGQQLLFADHATDFGAAPATAANSRIIDTPIDVQLDLTGVAASGGGRASAKSADLGATHSNIFVLDACLEFESAPADGGTVDFYWAESPSATAGTGNPAGLSGVDEAFAITNGKRDQMKHIGSLGCRAAVINIGHVGTLVADHRYGMLVVVNNTTANLRSTATAMDETHITLTEIISGAA